MAKQAATRWFNVDEYYRMAQTGILSEDDRVELIEGEVVAMSPIGSRHAACVGRLTDFFAQVRDRVIVWVQNPIKLGNYSEPVPDIALLKIRADFYAAALPKPEDFLVVIEVADASLEYDRDAKTPLYAETGIAAVVLANLLEDRVEYFTNPVAGKYQTVTIINRGESFMVQALPGLILSAAMILGESGS